MAKDKLPAADVAIEIERWQNGGATGAAESPRFLQTRGGSLKAEVLGCGGGREVVECGVAENAPPTGVFVDFRGTRAFPLDAVTGKGSGQVGLRSLMIGPNWIAAQKKRAACKDEREKLHVRSMVRKFPRARAR